MPKLVQTICIDTPEPTCGAHKSIVKDRTGLLPIEHKQDGGGHIYFCPLCAEDKVHNPLRSVVRRHIEVSHFQMRINHEEWMILPCELRCSSGFKTTHFHCPKCGHARAKDWNQLQAHMRSCTSVYTGPSSPQPAVSARQAALSNQDTGQHSVEASVSKTATQAAVNNTKRSSPRIVVSKSGSQQQEVDSPPVANVRQSTRIRWKVDQGKRHLEDSPSMKQEHESPVSRTEVLSNTAGTPEKRPRGRPRKRTIDETEIGQVKESPPVKGIPQTSTHDISESPSKRPRGRPRSKPRTDEEVKVTKIPESPTKAVTSSCTPGNEMDQPVKRKRGRPRKYTSESQDQQGIQKKLDIEVISRRMSKDSIGVKQSSMSTLNSSRSKITATSLTQKLDTGQKISSGQTEQADNPEGVGSNLNSIGDHLLYASPGRPSSKTRDVYKQRLLELEEEDKKNPDKPATKHKSILYQWERLQPVLAVKSLPCGRFRCPLCRPSMFRPAYKCQVVRHLQVSHFAHKVCFEDMYILPCRLECVLERGHWHCPQCGKPYRKSRFRSHVRNCLKTDGYSAAEINKLVAGLFGDRTLRNDASVSENKRVCIDLQDQQRELMAEFAQVPVNEISQFLPHKLQSDLGGSVAGEIVAHRMEADKIMTGEITAMTSDTKVTSHETATATYKTAPTPDEIATSAIENPPVHSIPQLYSAETDKVQKTGSDLSCAVEPRDGKCEITFADGFAESRRTTTVAADSWSMEMIKALVTTEPVNVVSHYVPSTQQEFLYSDDLEEETGMRIVTLLVKDLATPDKPAYRVSESFPPVMIETEKLTKVGAQEEERDIQMSASEIAKSKPKHRSIICEGEKPPQPVLDVRKLPQRQYFCPLCRPTMYKAAWYSTILRHLQRSHFAQCAKYKDVFVVPCRLECQKWGHWHCPLCGSLNGRKAKFIGHMKACSKRHGDPMSIAQCMAMFNTNKTPPHTRTSATRQTDMVAWSHTDQGTVAPTGANGAKQTDEHQYAMSGQLGKPSTVPMVSLLTGLVTQASSQTELSNADTKPLGNTETVSVTEPVNMGTTRVTQPVAKETTNFTESMGMEATRVLSPVGMETEILACVEQETDCGGGPLVSSAAVATEEDEQMTGEYHLRHISCVKSLKEIQPTKIKPRGPVCRYLCPLCRLSMFKPAFHTAAIKHIQRAHLAHRMTYKGLFILPCRLNCNGHPVGHTHCPECGFPVRSRVAFFRHMQKCMEERRFQGVDQVTWYRTYKSKGILAREDYDGDGETNVDEGEGKGTKTSACSVEDSIAQEETVAAVESLQETTPPVTREININKPVAAGSRNPRTVHRSVVHSLREIRPMPYKMGPCATSLYYCPLCRHSWFKPCILSKVFKHIEITHFAHQLEHNGKLVLPCHLTCNKTGKGHRHCPICGKITPNKLRFQMHLKHCNRHTHNASVYAKREQEYRAQLKNSMDWKVAWGLPTEVPAETNAVAAESGGAQVLAGANTETCEVVPDVSSGAETYEMVPSAVPVVELSEPGSSSGQITKPSGNDDPSVSRPSESSEMLLSTTQVGQPIETAPSASQADQPSEMIPSADQPEQSSKMAPIASQAEEPCEMVPSASQQTSETAPSVTSGGAGTDTATNAATTDVAVASDTTQLNLKSELQMDTGMASASGADTSILVHRVLTDEELTAASILSMVEKGIVTVSEASPQISQQIALETRKASLIQPVPEDSHQPPEATATEPVDEWVETHIGKHPSFVKDLTSLGLEPCATCCRDQCLYHCPLCTTATFKPGNLSKVQLHLYRSHWKKRVEYGGLKILKCSLPCVSGSTIYLHGHYHCPLCSVAKATRNKLLYHLSKPHDQFSDPSMAQLLDEERLVGYSGEDDDGGEYEGEGGYMDNYEEEDASSPPSPPKPKEVFQLVAALVTKDMLNLIPGSKDVFFHGLQKKTGVSFTMAEDKWCLLQGKWQPMQEAQCTLRKVLDGESPELGMPSSQDTSTQMAASLADTPAEATPKKTGGQVPSPAEVSPSMPQPSAATIPFGTNDDSNLDTSYDGMAAEEAEDDYDGDQGSSFVDDSTKASTSDQGQEKSDKEPNIANHPAINVVCDESGTCVLTISVPKEEESKPAKVEQKHDKKMFLPRRIDKTQKYKLFTDDRERTCYFCGKIFLQRPKLLQHLLSSGCAAERAGKAKYPEAVEELKTLIKEANERVKDRRCPLCKKQFSRSGDAKVHYLGRTCQRSKRGMHNPTGVPKDEKGMYKCRYCSFTAIRPNKIVIHEARLHIEKKFECTTCGKKYGTEYLLNMHVKTTHRPKTDLKMCHVCGKEMWYRYLQRHIKMKHDPNYKPQAYAKRLSQEMLQCGECPYQTRVPILMKRHTIRHHGEKKFICEVCGKSFAMKEDYSKHIAVHDPSAREKLLVKCEVCNKIMMKKNLNNHMRYVHEKRKDCECPVCGMKLQTTNTLRVHMERHKPPEARNMKYQCPHCNKGFYSKTHYTDHVNSHTNTRPYQCEICNKTFTWLSVYNKHKERHESPKEGKDYICACGCIFAKYTSLRNHQASCEMYQKEMYCECGQLFSTNAALRNHRATCEVWQTQHGTQEVTIIVEQDPSQPIEGQTLLQDIAGGQLQAADAPIQMAVDGTQLQLSEHIVEGMGGEVHIQVEQQEAIKEEADTSILDEQNRYLCGYCQQLFHGLTEVHTHMLEAHVQADMENGTQLQITLQSEEMNIE